MCIAIVNKRSTLSKETFKNSFENNPDGLGIAYFEGGRLKIKKSLKSYEDIYSKYLKVRKRIKTPIFIHARIGTSGGKTIANVHPFAITKDIAFMHNGVISYPKIFKDESDTRHLGRFIQKLSNPHSLFDPLSIEYGFIEDIAGSSKFCFLDNKGNVSIINEDLGHWDKSLDTWYSNDTYKKVSYKMYGNKKVYNSTYGSAWNCDYWNYKPAPAKKPSLSKYPKIERDLIEEFTGKDYDTLTDWERINEVKNIGDSFGYSTHPYYTFLDTIHEDFYKPFEVKNKNSKTPIA